VPVAALLPLHPDPGLLALTGLVALSYATLPGYAATGSWALPAWVPCVEFGGVGLVWLAAAAARLRAQRRTAACRIESPPT